MKGKGISATLDASWFKQLQNDSCVLCQWSRVIKRVCILCEDKNQEEGKKNQRITRNLLRNAKLLLWRDILPSRNFSPCMRQAACMEKNKTIPPPPLLPVRLSPLTLLTCIAGLVGVKIDWQSLNWKWSLNAGYSCWGFEFSLTPASQAADGENWWGTCRSTEDRSQGSWICSASGSLGTPARTKAGPSTTGTVELRWGTLLSAPLAMRTRVSEHRATCWNWIQPQTTTAVTVVMSKSLTYR